MSITRVVGYTADADYWCVSCAEKEYEFEGEELAIDNEGNELGAIFVLEVDSPAHCNQCHEFIEDQVLTEYGVEYVKDAIISDLEERNWTGTAWDEWLNEFGPYYDELSALYSLKYAGQTYGSRPGIEEAIERKAQ